MLTIQSLRGHCKQVNFGALGIERSTLCSSARVALPQANALLSGTEAEGLEHGENESFTGFMSYHTCTTCTEQHTHGSFSALRLAYGGGWNEAWGHRDPSGVQSTVSAHPLDSVLILWGMKREIALYACLSIMHLDLLCPFATQCLSRGTKPISTLRPQLDTQPAQAFSFWKTLRSLRRLNALSKYLPLIRSKYSPSLHVHPRTRTICPPHTQISWVFSPFMSISSRFMVLSAASSITWILPAHPSRICSPPSFT